MQDTFNLKEFCLRLSNKIDLPISLSPVLLGAALEGGLQLEQPQVVKIPQWPPLLPAVCLPASQVCEARRFPHFHCARLHCCILPSACFCAQAVWMTAGRQLHQLWMSGKALPSAVLCWISLPARCTPPHANNRGSPSSPGPRAGGRPPVSVLQQDRGRTAMRHDPSQERHALFQTFPTLWMKAFWLSLLQTAKILSFFVKVRDLQIKPLQSRT